MFDANKETVFIFPEQCSLGVIEGIINDSLFPRHFSVLELSLDSNDQEQFENVFHLIRQSSSFRFTHVPTPVTNEKQNENPANSLIISFHDSENNSNHHDDTPLVAAIITLDKNSSLEDISQFNENIVRMESVGLSIDFGEDMTILMLLELQAITEALLDNPDIEKFDNLLFSAVYYAEFQPRLKNTIDPIMHALNHSRTAKPSVLRERSVDLTGLLPDGLA